jgi:hypothetical protein
MQTSEDLNIEMLLGLVEQPVEDSAITQLVVQSAADLAPDPATLIDNAID